MPLKIDELNLLNPYEHMDEELDRLRLILVKRFKRIKLAKKGLNGVVRKVYDYLYARSNKMYLELARYYYEKAGGNKKGPDRDWLLDFLEDYDLLTGYQYAPEWDRKRARTYELAQSFRDNKKVPDLKRPETLLNQQITQKSIEVVDYATIKAYKDQGVAKVKWIAIMDERTCPECEKRHGQIYDINKIPGKHYFCRCWMVPYEDRSKDT